jgi:predicted DsbA family dithiol-disulfide isomerase
VRAARKAAREPEAAGTLPDLWLSGDPPVTTLPALAALEAARQQGETRAATLRAALREAALARGINVTRRDVLLELAAASGLDVARFHGSLDSEHTQKHVLAAWDDALAKGVESAPALVIDEEWLVAGPRTMSQYRAILRRYATARLGLAGVRVVH